MQFKTLTPTLHYHDSGRHTRRITLIKTEKSNIHTDPIIEIPGTTILLIGPDAQRQFGNWLKETTRPRDKFSPPLSGNTESKVKHFYGIKKYKLDQ